MEVILDYEKDIKGPQEAPHEPMGTLKHCSYKNQGMLNKHFRN